MSDDTQEQGGSILNLPSDRATREHQSAVGKVAGAWALLEMILDTRALQLAGIGDSALGMCFTAQISGSARKVDAYIAVASTRGAERAIRKLNKFAQDTTSLAERRNRTIHDPWIIKENEMPWRLEVTARRKLRTEWIHESTETIYKLAQDILKHGKRFNELHQTVLDEISALRETPP